MSVDGTWEVSMNTPMGEQKGTLTLSTEGGSLTGRMETAMGAEDIADASVDGNNAKWSIALTKPMPVTLKFDATVDGDTISGKVSLGMFGSSDLTGTRAS
ncbi:hypothetical protein [Aurantivibrio plasticivorans]